MLASSATKTKMLLLAAAAPTNTHAIDLEADSSQYLSIADGSQTGLDFAGDFTFEWNKKPESLPGLGVQVAFFSKWLATGDQRSYLVTLVGTAGSGLDLFVLITQTGSAAIFDQVRWTVTGLISVGTYYQAAITCDISEATASTFTLRIDGADQGNGTVITAGNAASIHNGSAPLSIGTRLNPGPTLNADGLFDDIRMWSDIRTTSEIDDNAAVELVGDEANLEGYWKLNNDATDSTANGNDLTETGSPVYSTDTAF